jgi:hypothetical protein
MQVLSLDCGFTPRYCVQHPAQHRKLHRLVIAHLSFPIPFLHTKTSLAIQILGRKFPQLLLNYHTQLEAIWSSEKSRNKVGIRVDDLLKQALVGKFAAAHNLTVE